MTAATVFFVLFAGALGAAPDQMTVKLWGGPLSSEMACYALGALAVDQMNRNHPDKDFRGACVSHDPEDADASASLSLHELDDRAMKEDQ